MVLGKIVQDIGFELHIHIDGANNVAAFVSDIEHLGYITWLVYDPLSVVKSTVSLETAHTHTHTCKLAPPLLGLILDNWTQLQQSDKVYTGKLSMECLVFDNECRCTIR